MKNNSIQKEDIAQQIQNEMQKIGKALLQLYRFQGSVWTDAFNPDEGLIMSCEGVSSFLTTLRFEPNKESKEKILNGKMEKLLIQSMIKDIIKKEIKDVPRDTTPYLDFLRTTGKTGEGMFPPEETLQEALEKMKLRYIESIYSFARVLWYVHIYKANLPKEISQNALNNCRTMISTLLDYSVLKASKIKEPKIKIVGWSYTDEEGNFNKEDIEKNGRQYFIPYYTFNVVNFVFDVLSMDPDTDTCEVLKSYDDYLIDLYEWIKGNFFSGTSQWKIEKEPITDFGNLLLDLGPTGFPLYNNVYILSTLILILAWQKEARQKKAWQEEKGQKWEEIDRNFQEKIKDVLTYITDEITTNRDYQWESADDTIGEHMFRLAGELWQAPRPGKQYHKKVFIDRSIYPMMLKALSLYGIVFEENMDEVLKPLLTKLFEMQIKSGRYTGMWYGKTPSIYYTNRVVDALVNLYQYVKVDKVKSSLDIAKIIKEVSIPIESRRTIASVGKAELQSALDDFAERMASAIRKIRIPGEEIIEEKVQEVVSKGLRKYKEELQIHHNLLERHGKKIDRIADELAKITRNDEPTKDGKNSQSRNTEEKANAIEEIEKNEGFE
jgi:hypothetical protein